MPGPPDAPAEAVVLALRPERSVRAGGAHRANRRLNTFGGKQPDDSAQGER